MRARDVYCHVSGGKVFARMWGELGCDDAPAPIVLLHDSLGCVELWRDFPATLAAVTGRAAIAYDRLGFGRSDARAGTLPRDFIREEARTVLPALRDALDLSRMVFYGHSVGGAMAVAAGAAFPEATEAIITESAQAFVEARTIAGVSEARAAMRAPDQIARLARYHGEKARWVLDAWTETWLSSAFADWSLDGDLGGVRCPILALHGDRDEYGTLAFPERIGALSPTDAKVVILDNCGHVPHRERPEVVLESVRAFLSDLAGSQSPAP